MRPRLLLAALLCSASVYAHEIGTSRVSVSFREGRYEVDLVTDAGALAEKLEASVGRPLPPASDAAHLKTIIEGFEETFRQRVALKFDGVETRPSITYAVEPPIDAVSASAATIRLTGEIPGNAHNFTWMFGWTFASYALTVNGDTQWLEGGDSSRPIPLTAAAARPDRIHTAWRYLTLGFTHIVPYGFDHVLFVLGLYLLSGRRRTVLMQVSAFTVAHSITLGLSMYGLVSVSSRIVEPMIALSIAYVAIENIFLSELKTWRIGLVFAFGLLHGLGFAGALRELGLPRSEFLTALLTFNVGVEAGQLAVISTAFLLVGWYGSRQLWYRSRVVLPASAVIACTAIYWTIQRLA